MSDYTPGPDTYGIFQPDLIIRTALEYALEDIRLNPWLLDFVFAGINQDKILHKKYKEESRLAKEWFLKQPPIPVFLLEEVIKNPTFPCVTIQLKSEEDSVELTLGDIHYQPYQNDGTVWAPLTPEFDVVAYDLSTGTVVIPESIAHKVSISTDLILVDNTGESYPILSVLDNLTFTIEPGLILDLSKVTIRPPRPSNSISLESSTAKGVYTIGVHTEGTANKLLWLYSIIRFILCRYRQTLLEARGFERSTFTSLDLFKDIHFEPQIVYSRGINLTGYYRNVWPKFVGPKINSTTFVPVLEEDGEALVGSKEICLDTEKAWLTAVNGIIEDP
jgi:hypothetical protein